MKKCGGSVATKWETLAARAVADANKSSDGHTRVHSGDVVWCSTCGAYADKKAHGMQSTCEGAPTRGIHYGGMWGQLRKLMRRVHPKTGEIMQEHTNADGSPWAPGLKMYANLRPLNQDEQPDKGFYVYTPEVRSAPIPTAEGVVQAATAARWKRILDKVVKSSVTDNPSGESVSQPALPGQGTAALSTAIGDIPTQNGDRVKRRIVGKSRPNGCDSIEQVNDNGRDKRRKATHGITDAVGVPPDQTDSVASKGASQEFIVLRTKTGLSLSCSDSAASSSSNSTPHEVHTNDGNGEESSQLAQDSRKKPRLMKGMSKGTRTTETSVGSSWPAAPQL